MHKSGEITFHPAETDDVEFLFGLFAERRTEEIAQFGWGESDALAFLKMQFDMRRKAYETRYPQSEHRVIRLDGVRVGEMIVHRAAKRFVLVDISISTEFRGRGVGSEAIRMLQNEVNDAKLPVILHVDRVNLDAQRLYQRIGFVVTDDSDQVTLEMKWSGNSMRN